MHNADRYIYFIIFITYYIIYLLYIIKYYIADERQYLPFTNPLLTMFIFNDFDEKDLWYEVKHYVHVHESNAQPVVLGPTLAK